MHRKDVIAEMRETLDQRNHEIASLRASLAEERAIAAVTEAARVEKHNTLREIAHALGVCYCADYVCEPAPRDVLVARVEELCDVERQHHAVLYGA